MLYYLVNILPYIPKKGGSKMELKVEKKDGRMESFNRNKIASSVTKAGGTQEQSESITSQVEGWAPSVAQNGVIKTSEIRTKVIELLKAVNPEAAARYEAYKKPA
jgi:transcriptional regulator NrdR family protein